MHVFTRNILLSFLFLSFFLNVTAQAPTITSDIGFPVGIKTGYQLVYANGEYLLLGQDNVFYHSADGTKWQFQPTTGVPSYSLYYLEYAANVYVAVGANGTIISSADGINWTERVSNTTQNLSKVNYLNGKFYAYGMNRTVLSSADGITWTALAINVGKATEEIRSMSYGNGVYVIGVRGDGDEVYRSLTAADNSWTSFDIPGVYYALNRIQYLNDRFFAFNSGNEMQYSFDGQTWTTFSNSLTIQQPDASTIPWGSGHQVFNGVWDGSKYIFYGSSQYYSGYGSVFTSSDLNTVTLLNKTAYFVPRESSFLNGKYFVTCSEGIVSSNDGLVYSHSGGSFNRLVKTPNKYVAIGNLGTSPVIYNSPTFGNWVNRSPASGKELYASAYDGSTLFAGGTDRILTSTDDGDSWTTLYNDPGNTYYSMASTNGILLSAVYGNMNGIAYSFDGTFWEIASSEDNYYHNIKVVNNKVFAMGYNNQTFEGVIMMSDDGIGWNNVTPTTLSFPVYYYKDVTFDGTSYHFLGIEMDADYNPKSFFTVATSTPINNNTYALKGRLPGSYPYTLGGTWDEGALEYSNGRFVGGVVDVSTGRDYIIYSEDGINYNPIPLDGASGIIGSSVSGNTFDFAGRGNAFYSVAFQSGLPVTYNYFDANPDGDKVKLIWSTSSEISNQYFNVLHSIDGQQWNEIGRVDADASMSLNKQYSFIHDHPSEGQNYYRLVQVDKDGKKGAGRVVTVNMKSSFKILMYPNPVRSTLNIRINAGQEIIGQARIISLQGQVLMTVPLKASDNTVDLSTLKKGMYQVEVITGQERISKLFMKN